MPLSFDSRKFINCKDERDVFEQMLTCDGDARVLSIEAGPGYGKSALLQFLSEFCRQRLYPASLVQLDDQLIVPSHLIERLRKDLRYDVEFHKFNRYYADIDRGSTISYKLAETSGPTIKLDLTNNQFQDAHDFVIAGMNVQVSERKLGAAEIEQMWVDATAAFFEDLKQCCEHKPVVLLLDTFDRCQEELRTWIMRYLLPNHFMNLEKRPRKLILVMAGREPPEFHRTGREEEIQKTVVRRCLGPWTSEAVEESAAEIGCGKVPPDDLKSIALLSARGVLPPKEIVDVMRRYCTSGG